MIKYQDIKISKETYKKFKQAKRLREFKENNDLTISEFLEIMLEKEFRRYDGQVIEKVR